MSNAGNIANLNTVTLFTFKGQIVVVYMDGTTIEGEFITQDTYNVFLKTAIETVMIPRQQIRLVKGKNNQPIEVDTSQASILSDTIATQPIPPGMVAQELSSIFSQTNDDRDDGTLILVPDQAPTSIAEAEDDDDENDGTMIIVPNLNQLAFSAAIETTEEEEPLDMTVVLDQALDLTPEEATAFLDLQEKSVTARLECIDGPHAGDSFTLSTSITTIGRSSDNTVVLSNDKEVSRHHVIILYELGKYVVQDQNSLNGTFVNDKQITSPYYLENGDTFLTGLSTFKYIEA